MKCKSCSEEMTEVHGQSHHHCRACNVFSFSLPTPNSASAIEEIVPQNKTTEFQCPKCILPLDVGLIHGNMQICFCNNCRGFVTPSESLGMIINELRSEYQGDDDRPVPIDADELEKFDNCPACLERMDSHPYYGPGNVVVNTCMHCKLAWLDHGELAKIVRAPGPRPGHRKTGNYESQVLRNQLQNQASAGRINLW